VLIAASVVALVFPALASAQGSTREIETGDSFFNPEQVSTDVGAESFHWQWGPPMSIERHNVREQNTLFFSGDLAISGNFTITPSAGTFPYVCDLHGSIASNGQPVGMAGTISVKPTATPQGKKTLVTWATETTDTGTTFDVQQKVGKGDPELVEKKTKEIEGVFKLKSGKKYEFQARSRQGKLTSEWSPKLKLKG
jgi:hypothetical protein